MARRRQAGHGSRPVPPCSRLRNPTCSRQSISRGHIMKRRSVLRAGVAGGVAALLPRFAIGQSADARALRFVPQANLTVLDPIVTTAAVTANHAWLVWETLFGVKPAEEGKQQLSAGYTISDDAGPI